MSLDTARSVDDEWICNYECGLEGATSEEVLSEGETFVESIPLWLIDKSNSDELQRQQTQRLSALMRGRRSSNSAASG